MSEYQIASPSKLADAKVLKPGDKSRQFESPRTDFLVRTLKRRTFVRVDHIVFDDDVPSIDSIVLLGLAPQLAQVGCRMFALCSGASSAGSTSPVHRRLSWIGDAQDMAGKEFVGRDSLCDGCAGGGFGLPGREENIGGRDQKDVMLDWLAL